MRTVRSLLIGVVGLGLAAVVGTGCAERPGKKKDDDKKADKKEDAKADKKDDKEDD